MPDILGRPASISCMRICYFCCRWAKPLLRLAKDVARGMAFFHSQLSVVEAGIESLTSVMIHYNLKVCCLGIVEFCPSFMLMYFQISVAVACQLPRDGFRRGKSKWISSSAINKRAIECTSVLSELNLLSSRNKPRRDLRRKSRCLQLWNASPSHECF